MPKSSGREREDEPLGNCSRLFDICTDESLVLFFFFFCFK